MTSDSTRDTISGKGLKECKSAIEHGVCPVWADNIKEKTHTKSDRLILA